LTSFRESAPRFKFTASSGDPRHSSRSGGRRHEREESKRHLSSSATQIRTHLHSHAGMARLSWPETDVSYLRMHCVGIAKFPLYLHFCVAF
jgi:hypothetical protein